MDALYEESVKSFEKALEKLSKNKLPKTNPFANMVDREPQQIMEHPYHQNFNDVVDVFSKIEEQEKKDFIY